MCVCVGVCVFPPPVSVIRTVVRNLLLICLAFQHRTSQTKQATRGTDDARTINLVFGGCVGVTNYNCGVCLNVFLLVSVCLCLMKGDMYVIAFVLGMLVSISL